MTITDKYVLFFGNDWPSNFVSSPITVYDDFWEKGLFGNEPYFPPTVTFKTAEAYFQSRKAVFSNDRESYYKIAFAQTPAETKKIARGIKLNSREWDKVRVRYMEETVRLKFSQNPHLLEKLLDPKFDDKIFVEASPWDRFWGVGVKESDFKDEDIGHGLNMLGKILTNFRFNELKKKR